MRNALRSLWREPPAPDNPGAVWWDRWLVGAVIVIALAEGLLRDDVVWRPIAIALAVALAFALLPRRAHPLTVVGVTFGLITVVNVVSLVRSDPLFGLYTMAFVLLVPYALLRWGSGREIIIGLGIVLVGYLTGIAADYTNFGEAVAALLFATSPALIGATVRYRTYARSRDRDRVVLEQREQLARELHDTVAHHVSAIAIQAQAGQTVAATSPTATVEALRVIEEEASKTLAEMRAMVGALRRDEGPDLAPVPGVADIEHLGHGPSDQPTVEVELSGSFDDIAPAVDAALYRVAQESITNAMKHARHATTVAVSVKSEGQFIRMTVQDDGEPPPLGGTPEPGFGLIGMTERAKLVGGSIEAGPASSRGWKVTAVIPKDGIAR